MKKLMPMYRLTLDQMADTTSTAAHGNEKLDVNSPCVAAIKVADHNLEIFRLVVAGLPLPYVFTTEYDQQCALQAQGKTTFMEVATFYNKVAAVDELLKISQYRDYARDKAGLLAEKSFSAGNTELAKRFLEMGGIRISPEHLHLALQHCSSGDCEQVLTQVLAQTSPGEVLEYVDNNGNNVLHLVAMLGRRDFLFVLAKTEVFNFLHPTPAHRAALNKQNVDHCRPFVVAIQTDNIDLANALYVRAEKLSELSDEEFNVITTLAAPTQALSQLRDEIRYPQEAKLWNVLFPQKAKILKLLDRLGDLAFYEQKEPKRVFSQKHKDTEDKAFIGCIAKMIKKGKIGQLLPLMLFRKDMFHTAALMEPTFKARVSVYSALMNNLPLQPLALLFVRMGFRPETGEEIAELFNKPELVKESSLLFMLEALSVIKSSSGQSLSALAAAPSDSPFLSPYNFFIGDNKPVGLGAGSKLSIEEFYCLVPSPEERPAAVCDIDLAKLGLDFFNGLQFRAFITIFLYAHQYEPGIFAKLEASLDANSVFDMFFHEHPACIPLILALIPKKLSVSFDPSTGKFMREPDVEISFSKDKNTAAGLLYLALYSSEGLFNVAGANTSLEKVRYLLSYVLFNQLGIYGAAKAATETKGGRLAAELNEAKRALDIWIEVVKKMHEIAGGDEKLDSVAKIQVPSKMRVSEAELSEMVAKLLDPSEVLFHTGNGFMTIKVDIAELFKAAKAVASIKREKSLVELVSLLLSEKFVLAVEEIKDLTEKYVVEVTVKFTRETSQPAFQYRLEPIADVRVPKEYTDSCIVAYSTQKIYRSPFSAHKVGIELTVNVSPDQFGKSPQEALSKLNSSIYTEVTLALIKNSPPLKTETATNQVYTIDYDSVKRHIPELETLFFTDVSSRLRSLCTQEVETLVKYLNECSHDRGSIAVPETISDLHISEPLKAKLKADLHGNKMDVLRVCVRTEEEWQALAKPPNAGLLDSMRIYTDPDLTFPSGELTLLLPRDPSMQNPERWLVAESHPQFEAFKVFAAEARMMRRIESLGRGTAKGFIRMDMEEFVRQVALPLSQAVRKLGIEPERCQHYTDAVQIVEEFCDFSSLLPALVKRLMTQFNDIYAANPPVTLNLLLTFAEGKRKSELPTENLPVSDKLIHFVDCELKYEDTVCTLTLLYENTWNGPDLAKLLVPEGNLPIPPKQPQDLLVTHTLHQRVTTI